MKNLCMSKVSKYHTQCWMNVTNGPPPMPFKELPKPSQQVWAQMYTDWMRTKPKEK